MPRCHAAAAPMLSPFSPAYATILLTFADALRRHCQMLPNAIYAISLMPCLMPMPPILMPAASAGAAAAIIFAATPCHCHYAAFISFLPLFSMLLFAARKARDARALLPCCHADYAAAAAYCRHFRFHYDFSLFRCLRRHACLLFYYAVFRLIARCRLSSFTMPLMPRYAAIGARRRRRYARLLSESANERQPRMLPARYFSLFRSAGARYFRAFCRHFAMPPLRAAPFAQLELSFIAILPPRYTRHAITLPAPLRDMPPRCARRALFRASAMPLLMPREDAMLRRAADIILFLSLPSPPIAASADIAFALARILPPCRIMLPLLPPRFFSPPPLPPHCCRQATPLFSCFCAHADAFSMPIFR